MKVPDKRVLHTVLAKTAEAHSSRIAIEQGDRSICYADLRAAVVSMSQALADAGVGRDLIVGACLGSSIEYVTSILAIMEAGGIFLPLDLGFPTRRIEQMLATTPPSLVIASEESRERVAEILAAASSASPETRIAVIDSDLQLQLACADTSARPARPAEVAPDDASYIMYTSGSTGVPKAILGCHKSLSHFMHWEAGELGLDQDLRVSQLAPVTFDASLRDILLPLMLGGRVCIPMPTDRSDPRLLVDWLESSQINLVHCVPSLFRVLTSEVERRGATTALPHLQRILMAGEALYGKDVQRWIDLVGDRIELVNLYGPSETTLIKTFYRISERPASASSIVPVGKPIANTAILILKGDRLCEIGEIGDIYIKTPFASKGYYGDPQLTAKSFVQNPLNPDQEDVIYRTGDIGRYLPDRSVEFIGRLDSQVKVNGIRIELAEIEEALAGCPALDQAVAVAIRNPENENVLTCYYAERAPISIEEIRQHLTTHLPEYMVPTLFVRMDELPLSINGKVDRNALPKPEELLYNQVQYEPPADSYEERIAAIWAEVLGLNRVGVNNLFIELGGNSLSAIRIISRIFQAFEVEVSILAFFENATVRKLAKLVGSTARSELEPAEIQPVEDQPDYRLSHAQRRLWVLGQMEQGLAAYNLTHAVILEGELDHEALDHAFAEVIVRHESLRTVFVTVDGEPRQKVIDQPRVSVDRIDLSAEPDPDAAVQALIADQAAAVFDLTHGPLIRLKLAALPAETSGAARHLLVLTLHHIISDGWSMGVLASELAEHYRSYQSGSVQESPLEPLRIQYRDYSAWQHRRLAAEASAGQREHWLDQLSGEIPRLNLPTDSPRPPVVTYQGRSTRTELDAGLVTELKALAEEAQASLFMVLVAAVKILLSRISGQDEIVIGTPVAGRDHPDLEDQIGFYANTLVLRDRLRRDDSFLATLARIKQTCLAAFAHQTYPFDRLVDELEVAREMNRNPLFDVLVALQDDSQPAGLPGIRVSELEVDEPFSRFDLTFNFTETSAGIRLDLSYSTDLFSDERMAGMCSHLHQLCRDLLRNPQQPIHELSLLTEVERQQLLNGFGLQRPAWDGEATLAGLFEAQVDQRPQQTAVICGEQHLTYDQLNRQADQVAVHLQHRHGVKPGDPVGLMMERSQWSVIGLLGIIKSGAAYLPLDPSLPRERLRFMIEDSGCRLILTDSESASWCTDDPPLVDIGQACRPGGPDRKPVETDGKLAYIIYTSGSTGRPKGVMVAHQAFINMSLDQIASFGVTDQDRVLQFFSIAFDGSLSEIFMALLAGASLVVAGREAIGSPDAFQELLEGHQVTVATLPPVYLRRLDRNRLDTLKVLITAGEPPYPADALHYSRQLRYFNAYGPTETAVCAAFHLVDPDREYGSGVPIGRPVAGLEIYILDDQLSPVPIGVSGEICISGCGLASGYLNRSQLTAETFVPHPFMDNSCLYRSGDLGRWLPNGEIELVGRRDDQVKIRGFRIELGEIEQTILQHPEVDQVAVVKQETDSGAELVAFLAGDRHPDLAQLRAHLRSYLPEAMLPSAYVSLDELPLTTSGKVDRRQLHADCGRRLQQQPPHQTPRDQIERRLVAIWEQVLQTTAPGIDDSFFEVGGHSIRAIELASEIGKAFDCELPLVQVYQSPTIRELAELVRARTNGELDLETPYIVFNRDAETTVFAFPPVAGAYSMVYEQLARKLEICVIYGFHFIEHDDPVPEYVELIKQIQPVGPYRLFGYSAGGNLAFRVARQLSARGDRVADVILLDAYLRDQSIEVSSEERNAELERFLEDESIQRIISQEVERDRYLRKVDQYWEYISRSLDQGIIDADIHLIKAADNGDATEIRKWQGSTSGRLHEYDGLGSHHQMLRGEQLEGNARIIRGILSSFDLS
jgi:amino acid adenylation domain-containing protein